MQQDILEILRQKTAQYGLRRSAQREKVVKVFLSAKRHITAEDLLALVRKKYAEIGFATVYRTIKLLCRYGIANEIKIGSNKAMYELAAGKEHHDHLICINCGAITEVFDKKIEALQDKLAQANDFKPLNHRMEIFGLCKKCK